MIDAVRRAAAEYRAHKRFHALPAKERALTFYAEGAGEWPHYEPILRELTGPMGLKVCYVTSAHSDPVLTSPLPGITPFCIGSGLTLPIFFQSLRTKLLVTTIPDLDRFHVKRSFHPVHYLYLFHSINSTHMVYRPHAFDAYDTVFCVGPHHMDEIRRSEEVYQLKPKTLVEHGYGRLDAIVEKFRALPPFVPSEGAAKRLVYAPSWGVGSSIETPYGTSLLPALLEAGHHVTVRLHPMTVRHHPELPRTFEQNFGSRSNFILELDMKAQDSLQRADLMIGDWSGAALEFAMGLGRPVISIDTPPKVNNPEYMKIDLPPLEKQIRYEIGSVVPPDKPEQVLEEIPKLCANGQRLQLKECNRWVFNLGHSGKVGAQYIGELLERL